MGKVIEESFFNRSTEEVCRDLLGKFLVRRIGEKEISSMITETECYDGVKDRASHAFKGKTGRNEPMFGEPGCFYVYLCYGIHFMLNLVTRETGYPGAVLVRAVKDVSGPGRVTKYFNVNKSFNKKVSSKKSGLWVEDRGFEIKKGNIGSGKRVGVCYAGPEWSNKHLRFYLKDK